MKCPDCSSDTRVIDSRPAEGAIRRRRECLGCERRFTTFERVAELEPVVVKRDGRREPFQWDKLLRGIRLACTKRAVPEGSVERLAATIRLRAVHHGAAEVTSEQLGEWVLEQLRTLDGVAAFRFASVFRRPEDADALRRELAAVEGTGVAPAEPEAGTTQPALPGIGPVGNGHRGAARRGTDRSAVADD